MRICVCVVVACVAMVVSATRVRVNQGGYEDVVVAISDEVDPQYCVGIIKNMKVMLTKASEYLHESTQRLYFRSFYFLLPSNWDTCDVREVISDSTFQTYQSSDIRISRFHPIYGNAPWTEQYGGCGVRGNFLQIGFEYIRDNLTSLYGPKERVLIHEWAKLRFGVFDEYGYPGDPLYPTFYRAPGDAVNLTPTFCTDVPLVGREEPVSWDANQSVFLPDQDKNDDVLSSLMSLQYLKNVRSFCDAWTHQKGAPTKQNALCDLSSTWEVAMQSPDLKNQPTSGIVNTVPSFSLVRKARQRIVLLVDGSRDMGLHDRLMVVWHAMRNFLLCLPLGTKIGVVLYKDPVAKTVDLTEVNQHNRYSLLNQNLEAGDGPSTNKLRDGVNMAVEMLEADTGGTDGAHVVIITCEREQPQQFGTIMRTLVEKHIFTDVISYPQNTYPGFRQLALETEGRWLAVPERVVLDDQAYMGTMTLLLEALTSLMDEPNILGERTFYSEEAGEVVQGTLSIPEGVTSVRLSLNFYCYTTTYLPTENVVKDSNNASVQYARHEGIWEYTETDPAPGKWTFSFKNTAPSPQVTIVDAWVLRKTHAGPVITIWTSWDDTPEPDPRKVPLIVYVRVTKLNMVVTEADVSVLLAPVTTPEAALGVKVFDDGRGEPDIQQGDGIYSGYFLGVMSAGNPYQVSVKVTSRPGVTSQVSGYQTGRLNRRLRNFSENRVLPQGPEQIGVPYCCGSRLPPNVIQERLTFDPIVVKGPTVLTVASVGALDDIYPPGKVVDLVVDGAPSRDFESRFSLRWTAPGSDYNTGTVQRYDIRYSEALNELVTTFEDCALLRTVTDTHEAGAVERLTEVGTAAGMGVNNSYYIAMKAYDGTFFGKLSNVVSLTLIPPDPGEGGVTTLPPLEVHGSGLSLSVIVGIVLGSFFTLLLIIVIIVVCCLCCRRRRANQEGKGDKVSIAYPSEKKVGYDNICYPTPKDKASGQVYTINSPVSWTASQLLSEHEKRRPSPTLTPDSTRQSYLDALYMPQQNRASSYLGDTISSHSGYTDPSAGIRMVPDPDIGIPEPRQFPEASLGSSHPSDSYLSLSSDRERKRGPPTLPKPRTSTEPKGYHPIYSTSASTPTDLQNKTYRNITEV